MGMDRDIITLESDSSFGEEEYFANFNSTDGAIHGGISNMKFIRKSAGATVLIYGMKNTGKTSISSFIAYDALSNKMEVYEQNGNKLPDPKDPYEFTTSVLLSHSFLKAASMLTPAFNKLISAQLPNLDELSGESYAEFVKGGTSEGGVKPRVEDDIFLLYYKNKIDKHMLCVAEGFNTVSAAMARIYAAVKMNLLPDFIISPSILNSAPIHGQVVNILAEDTSYGVGDGPVITLDTEIDGLFKFRDSKDKSNPPSYFTGMINAVAAIVGYYAVARISAYNEWLIYNGVISPETLGGSRTGGLSASFVGSVMKCNLKNNAIGSDVIIELRHDYKDNLTLEALTKTLVSLDSGIIRLRDDDDAPGQASNEYGKTKQDWFDEINKRKG